MSTYDNKQFLYCVIFHSSGFKEEFYVSFTHPMQAPVGLGVLSLKKPDQNTMHQNKLIRSNST